MLSIASLENWLKKQRDCTANPDLQGVIHSLDELHDIVKEISTEMLQPALNAYLENADKSGFLEKKHITSNINELLDRYELAIKCPNTGQPTRMATAQLPYRPQGQFRLEVVSSARTKRHFTGRFNEMSNLTCIPKPTLDIRLIGIGKSETERPR